MKLRRLMILTALVFSVIVGACEKEDDPSRHPDGSVGDMKQQGLDTAAACTQGNTNCDL